MVVFEVIFILCYSLHVFACVVYCFFFASCYSYASKKRRFCSKVYGWVIFFFCECRRRVGEWLFLLYGVIRFLGEIFSALLCVLMRRVSCLRRRDVNPINLPVRVCVGRSSVCLFSRCVSAAGGLGLLFSILMLAKIVIFCILCKGCTQVVTNFLRISSREKERRRRDACA